MHARSWSAVAALRGVPCITFGSDSRAGGDGYAINASWWVLPDAANDGYIGPEAA